VTRSKKGVIKKKAYHTPRLKMYWSSNQNTTHSFVFLITKIQNLEAHQ
jgi:hypothetical protein